MSYFESFNNCHTSRALITVISPFTTTELVMAKADLSNGPFDHRSTGQTGTVDFLIVVVRVGQVLGLHLVADFITVESNHWPYFQITGKT